MGSLNRTLNYSSWGRRTAYFMFRRRNETDCWRPDKISQGLTDLILFNPIFHSWEHRRTSFPAFLSLRL
jgi:hypothetical protein